MTMEAANFSKIYSDYLSNRLSEAQNLELIDPVRIFGGASRETWIATMTYDGPKEPVSRRIVIRITQDSALIETDAAVEFNAYKAFFGSSVPVPEPLFLEQDGSATGHPFVVMAAVDGAAGSIMDPNPYTDHRVKVGQQCWNALGAIARADISLGGLDGLLDPVAPELCWRRELDKWEKVLDEDEPEPLPIARGAIRWMRNNPPPPPERLHVVHGDFRTGNYLVTEDGTVSAVLDWEMCHLGDAHEDLAWALSPLWCFGDPAESGGTIPRADAIALWEAAAGLKVNLRSLDWWEKFACIKGLAIWHSAGNEFQTGKNTDSINLFPAWRCVDVHNRILVDKFQGAST